MHERNLEFWDEDQWRAITSSWPEAVQRGFAARLRIVQHGGYPPSRDKPLKGFAIPLREMWHRAGQRIVYTLEYVTLTNLIHVLDAFEKDSKKGKKMRAGDKARIEARVRMLKGEMDKLKALLATGRQSLH